MRSPRDYSLVATRLAVVIEPPYPNVAAFLTPPGAGEAVALIPARLDDGTFVSSTRCRRMAVDVISMVDDSYAVYSSLSMPLPDISDPWSLVSRFRLVL
ncbi:MAG: hypothetical protein ACR2NT_04180 [Acidimicrobiia bacterium]